MEGQAGQILFIYFFFAVAACRLEKRLPKCSGKNTHF